MRIIRNFRSLFSVAQWNKIGSKTFSKFICGVSFVGCTGYLINQYGQHVSDEIFRNFPVKSINAYASRADQIKSLNFIADVVESISPSVISITVGSTVIATSFGSGFIVDESGYAITNAHVVGKNSLVHVKLHNGKIFPGEVIAIDRSSDLALIKFNPGNSKLQALVMADTYKLRPGEFVIALGSPMTLSNSVTVGVVSAVGRDLGHSKGLKYVQTDAIITVGNSGGPLVNLYGEVVGVNTMMASTGFGFAIPSNHCREFVELALNGKKPSVSGRNADLKSSDGGKGSVEGGRSKYLGVVMGSLTPQMATEFNQLNPGYSIRPQFGVVIHSVFDMSPAHKCGLLPGDIVESANGTLLHSPAELMKSMKNLDSIDIAVIRKGNRFVLKNVTPEYD